MAALRSSFATAWPIILLAAVAGCEVDKSENPLSPSIAGPIAGVEITAPRALNRRRARRSGFAAADTPDGRERHDQRRPAAVLHVRSGERQCVPTKVFARSGVNPDRW